MKRSAFGIVAVGAVAAARVTTAGPVVEVYKRSTCGCCGMWVDHLRTKGFTTNFHD